MNPKAIRANILGVLLVLVVTAGAGTLVSLPAVSQTLQMRTPQEDLLPNAPGEPAKRTAKVPLAFRTAELFLAGGTAFDMTTTARSLDHPTTALRSDGALLGHYYVAEQGWAGVFGRRDPYTAIAANVILNYEVDRFSRRLYARGGRWRMLSYGLLTLKGATNTWAAASNIRNSERIDAQVRLATGYRGQIVWAR